MPEAAWAGDGLVHLVGEVRGHQEVAEDVAGGALEPNVEEVGELGVVDVVVVGRVKDDGIDRCRG